MLAASGCGTIHSPWTGWERQVEAGVHGAPRAFRFSAGFWAASRPVRLGTGVAIGADRPEEGRPWFLPEGDLDSVFLVDGAHDVALEGICLEGRAGRAKHGIHVRCGTQFSVRACRFDDFTGPEGAAVLVCGESSDRWVRGAVIERCTFRNGTCAVRIERDASDLLVADNRIEEFTGVAIDIDPGQRCADYALLVVENRIRSSTRDRKAPLLRVAAGAQNLRVARNTFEGLETDTPPPHDAPAAIEVRGDGSSRRRLEFMVNTLAGIRGPALEARDCGPGLVACGNQVVGAGTARKGAIDLSACCGALVEDNEIHDPCGPGVRLHDCRSTRAHGNELHGAVDPALPRSAGAGLLVEGAAARRIRISDNRVSGTRDAGILVTGGLGLRLVGNEVQDCGEGIRVRRARALLLVGNDCRDNGGAGIAIEDAVQRGLVALNYAALNGAADLTVLGRDVTARDNRVDREP